MSHFSVLIILYHFSTKMDNTQLVSDINNFKEVNNICRRDGCQARAVFGVRGTSVALTVDVRLRLCEHSECEVMPSYATKGSLIPLKFNTHKKIDDVNIVVASHEDNSLSGVGLRLCESPGCMIVPSYAMKGCLIPLRCGKHRKYYDVNVRWKNHVENSLHN